MDKNLAEEGKTSSPFCDASGVNLSALGLGNFGPENKITKKISGNTVYGKTMKDKLFQIFYLYFQRELANKHPCWEGNVTDD